MPLSQTFSSLSDENRRRILELLKGKEMSVSEIGEHFKVTMPTLSHHLDILRRAGLVESRRSGQQIIYSINLSVFEDVAEKIIIFLQTGKGKKPSRKK